MARKKSKETLFNELIDAVDALGVFSLGGRFDEWHTQLYDHTGDGIGRGELALRTKIRNIIGCGFNETNYGGKKNLDLHDVDVCALDARVLRAPQSGGQDIKACVDCQFRDEGSYDAVGRLRYTLGRAAERDNIHSPELEDLACGTLSAKQIKVIEQTSVSFATLIRNTLSAANLTKRYPEGIQVVNKHGHLGVPTHDYADAFECTGISKGVAKYRLSRSYIERRLQETLVALQNVKNGATVDSVGHHVDEPVTVACCEHPTTVFT